MGHPCLHRCLLCYMYVQGYLKPSGFFPISYWKLDFLMCLVWILSHILSQLRILWTHEKVSFPLSKTIFIHQDTWFIYVVSTNFTMVNALFLSCCIIKKHPTMVLIIATYFIIRSLSFTFLHMTCGPITYTQSLFHGISSANVSGDLPYFYLTIFYIGKCHSC